MDGGVISRRSDRNAPIRSRVVQNSGYFAASRAENGLIAAAVCAGSLEKTRGRPSMPSATRRGSGRTNFTPRRSSCMSRTIDGRIGPSVCASVDDRNPGANSSLVAQPPTSARRSSTSGLRPALAR